MRNIFWILLLLNPLHDLLSQTTTWQRTFQGDTVYYKITGNERFGKASIEAKYTNEQLKFNGNIVNGRNIGTWKFKSINGITLAIVNYDSLKVSQIDTAFIENMNFTKKAILKSDSIVKYCFGNNFVSSKMYLHHGESKQMHFPKSYGFYETELFEPHDKKVDAVSMIYSVKGNPQYWFAQISLDSTLNFRNINFDPDRRYNLKINSSDVILIAKSKGWKEKKTNGYSSRISEPNLKLEYKEPVWSIGYCIYEDDEIFSLNQKCKYLIIHSETGEVKEALSHMTNWKTKWSHN